MAEISVKTQVHFRDETGRFATAIDEGAHLAVTSLAERGADLARGFAPRRTGALASSIQPFVLGFLSAGWGAGVRYAADQEFGTSAHVIANRAGPQDPVANEQQDFFSAHAVRHPGNRASRFIARSATAIRQQAGPVFEAFLP